MADVVLEYKDEHALDVLELKNGAIMFRCAYNEAVDLIKYEKPIQTLIKMRELKDKKFEAWQKAFANAEGSHIEEGKREAATRCVYKYDGAYTMCKAMYGEETIRNVISVYFGDLNR